MPALFTVKYYRTVSSYFAIAQAEMPPFSDTHLVILLVACFVPLFLL